MCIMKILIYGAGAVGGYLGAKLLQQNHEVTLVAREVTAELINLNGLTITEDGSRHTVQPLVVTSLVQAFNEEQTYDLIILGMKSYDLPTALDQLVAFCPEPNQIMTTENGIGIEEPWVKQFGAERVLAGSVTIPLRKETSDHIVVEKDDRGLGLAPTMPKQNIKRWVSLFRKTRISTDMFADYEEMKWSKVLLNIMGNATAAILNRRPGLIYKSDLMFEVEIRMLRETLDVMKAKKLDVVDLPGASAKRLAFGVKRMPKTVLRPIMANLVTNGRGDKMPSFQMDLTSSKGKSEVIYHNGAIAEAGQAVGKPAPINAALNEILVKLTLEALDWREFDGRPKRLVQEIKRYQAALSVK